VDLERFTRPSVAVDAAVLTLDETGRELQVLLVPRSEEPRWALPGTFLHEGEVLADAVRRALTVKTGVDGVEPRQLHVFDALGRDERGWVLTVAHVAVVRRERLAHAQNLVPVSRIRRLRMAWDHPAIIAGAVDDLRERYARAADPDRLLGHTFTMRELLDAHSAVAGEPLQRDNFRRAMREHVEPAGEMAPRGRGRPAELFRRARRKLPR
jgi:8-oxo-dGTP diphosphatase